jgi:hypothetical protein
MPAPASETAGTRLAASSDAAPPTTPGGSIGTPASAFLPRPTDIRCVARGGCQCG